MSRKTDKSSCSTTMHKATRVILHKARLALFHRFDKADMQELQDPAGRFAHLHVGHGHQNVPAHGAFTCPPLAPPLPQCVSDQVFQRKGKSEGRTCPKLHQEDLLRRSFSTTHFQNNPSSTDFFLTGYFCQQWKLVQNRESAELKSKKFRCHVSSARTSGWSERQDNPSQSSHSLCVGLSDAGWLCMHAAIGRRPPRWPGAATSCASVVHNRWLVCTCALGEVQAGTAMCACWRSHSLSTGGQTRGRPGRRLAGCFSLGGARVVAGHCLNRYGRTAADFCTPSFTV